MRTIREHWESANGSFRPIADISRLAIIHPMTNALLSRLRSPDVQEQIAATYELDRRDFASADVLDAVRANLNSTDNDLIEISIVRLLIRGRDTRSADSVLGILEAAPNNLVFSAAVFGLRSLAEKFPETATRTISAFENLRRSRLSDDKLKLLNEQLAELSQVRS